MIMSHNTKDSGQEDPFNLLSEMDQAEEVGDKWYDAKITPLPPPLDEHVELPTKVPGENVERKEAKSTQGKVQPPEDGHPEEITPGPPFPTPRSRSQSFDEERMPTWIPFHMPGCQHAWHHHPHHRRENTSHPGADSTAVSSEGPPCECHEQHLSTINEKIKEKKQAKQRRPSMQWWPEPESIAEHEWVDRDGKASSGFGMDEALSEDDELALGEM
ncbi:hypothetical protein DV737_g4704, partial [Chaetothyriales sp. CBS 132003]